MKVGGGMKDARVEDRGSGWIKTAAAVLFSVSVLVFFAIIALGILSWSAIQVREVFGG